MQKYIGRCLVSFFKLYFLRRKIRIIPCHTRLSWAFKLGINLNVSYEEMKCFMLPNIWIAKMKLKRNTTINAVWIFINETTKRNKNEYVESFTIFSWNQTFNCTRTLTKECGNMKGAWRNIQFLWIRLSKNMVIRNSIVLRYFWNFLPITFWREDAYFPGIEFMLWKVIGNMINEKPVDIVQTYQGVVQLNF